MPSTGSACKARTGQQAAVAAAAEQALLHCRANAESKLLHSSFAAVTRTCIAARPATAGHGRRSCVKDTAADNAPPNNQPCDVVHQHHHHARRPPANSEQTSHSTCTQRQRTARARGHATQRQPELWCYATLCNALLACLRSGAAPNATLANTSTMQDAPRQGCNRR